ncbi:MAG: peptidoglycan-binding protein [Methanobacterium sp. ERen5]|nr:MAG: peptidoglycan-binding protein [Methanobacterium sp. ERen5]
MRFLKTGDRGKDVLTLKIWLNKYRFRDNAGKPLNTNSDLFDVSMRQGLKRFQRAANIPPTGKFDLATQRILPNYNPDKPIQGVGYFINPEITPLDKIEWSGLRAKGITEVYVRIVNANFNQFGPDLTSIVKAGLKPFAWVWQGFSYTSYLTLQGWNMVLDMETYEMPKFYSEIRGIQNLCKANKKTFILCTKAQEWDGKQYWNIIKDYCDYLMPMLYLNDYKKSLSQLTEYMKIYNKEYPGKIYPALETYESDQNVVSKSNSDLMSEINAIKPYCKGFGLFRYGLSNY